MQMLFFRISFRLMLPRCDGTPIRDRGKETGYVRLGALHTPIYTFPTVKFGARKSLWRRPSGEDHVLFRRFVPLNVLDHLNAGTDSMTCQI